MIRLWCIMGGRGLLGGFGRLFGLGIWRGWRLLLRMRWWLLLLFVGLLGRLRRCCLGGCCLGMLGTLRRLVFWLGGRGGLLMRGPVWLLWGHVRPRCAT